MGSIVDQHLPFAHFDNRLSAIVAYGVDPSKLTPHLLGATSLLWQEFKSDMNHSGIPLRDVIVDYEPISKMNANPKKLFCDVTLDSMDKNKTILLGRGGLVSQQPANSICGGFMSLIAFGTNYLHLSNYEVKSRVIYMAIHVLLSNHFVFVNLKKNAISVVSPFDSSGAFSTTEAGRKIMQMARRFAGYQNKKLRQFNLDPSTFLLQNRMLEQSNSNASLGTISEVDLSMNMTEGFETEQYLSEILNLENDLLSISPQPDLSVVAQEDHPIEIEVQPLKKRARSDSPALVDSSPIIQDADRLLMVFEGWF